MAPKAKAAPKKAAKAKAEKAKAKAKAVPEPSLQAEKNPEAEGPQATEGSLPSEASPKAEGGEQAQGSAKVKVERCESMPKDAAKKMLGKLNYLDSKGDPGPLAHYRSLKSQQQKRQFYFETFRIDPTCAAFSAREGIKLQTTHEQSEVEGWVTADVIAQMNGFLPAMANYEELKAALVSHLPWKAHDDPHVAALGVRLYHYTHANMEKTMKAKTKGLELTKKASMDEAEYLSAEAAFSAPPAKKQMVQLGGGASSSSGLLRLPPKKPDEGWAATHKQVLAKAKKLTQDISGVVNDCRMVRVQICAKSKALAAEKQSVAIVNAYQEEIDLRLPHIEKALSTYITALATIPEAQNEQQASKAQETIKGLMGTASAHKIAFKAFMKPIEQCAQS